jgi:flagellar M-ring protein FliF
MSALRCASRLTERHRLERGTVMFRQLSTQLQQLWSRMSAGMRTLVAVTVVASVAAVGGVGWWSQQTDYQPVFTGLALEDVGAITSKLTAQGIPYRLAGAGTTVLVPVDQVQQVRVSMSVDGLPAKGGGKGYDALFDQTSFGMTPFTQHINRLRAEQNEIAKTIMQIDPVVFARVHISRPEPSPFIRESKATTASVMLKLRANATLSRNVGAGIAAFVARSVEGLTKENVTLMDTAGRILFQETAGDEGAMTSALDYRRDLESYLASKAEGMLASVLGPGKANVRINVDVSTKTNRERKETLSPIVNSESTTTTKTIGSEGSKSGAVGASANNGKAGTASGSSKESNSITENIETKYAVAKTVQEIDDKMGAIQRLTIAAFVELPPPEKDGASLDLAKVKEIIKNAVGFKSERDEITVTQMKFAEPKLPVLEPEPAPTPAWVNWLDVIRNASIALAALVTCLLGITMVRRGAPKPAVTATPSLEDSGDILRFQKLTQALEKNPEALAKVLDNWLKPPANPPSAAA